MVNEGPHHTPPSIALDWGSWAFVHSALPASPTRSHYIQPNQVSPRAADASNSFRSTLCESDLIRPNPTKISNLFSILCKVAPRPAPERITPRNTPSLQHPGPATDNGRRTTDKPGKVNQTKSNQFKPPPLNSCGPLVDQFRVHSTNFDLIFF